ncbi:MAG: ATP-dependent DNA helicase RecG [Muribaculaceae bacterium]|nr:ATP-dependent DNA helicase RecG [Muribaculaceae bacterium]
MNSFRSLNIMYLKGIGPSRAELLQKELGIATYYDLLHHFPSHYVDRSVIYKVRDLNGEMPYVQLKGRFVSFNILGEGARSRLVALFSDGTATMEVVWFRRIKQIRELYKTGNEYIIFGKPTLFNHTWSMVHPEVDLPSALTAAQGFRGVYPLTEKLRNKGIGSRTIFGWIQTLLSTRGAEIKETLSASLLEELHLMPLREAIQVIHNPKDNNSLQRARFRLKFEELFFLQLNMRRYSRKRNGVVQGFRFSRVGSYFNNFYSNYLPFPLTGAQKRVIKEIRKDMGSGRQMNRLLQGDVGSGKTVVALLTTLIALDNNVQACLMAPTEILATQHFETISKLVAPIGVNVKLLTGSTRKKEREEIDRQLQDGTLHILIGTHAVIEEKVKFRNLGFVIIDEQHRFGVVQRARLWQKNVIPPHILVMTATPIPRTLAMTVYGDLDVSVIDELPPGRKPVQTIMRYENQRFNVYRSIGRQLREGRQVYIVYPLITENEKLDLKSLEEGYESVCETFPSYKVAFVHGKMKPKEKDYQMGLFASGEAQILVATTVIEVGVNVPNATTMVIENAERFGLSQLHQLRGRVGRGADQSYCVLMTKQKIARETRQRLEIMTETTDGFVVAEADLKMRGPGDLEGTMQSGIAFDLHIANLATDGQIVQLAHDWSEKILDSDPELASPENMPLRNTLRFIVDRAIDFGRIS